MAEFPLYRQLDLMDCGPTCLRMIARHYGRSVSAQLLREKSQLAREGATLLGVAEAAEAIGFRTMGVELGLEGLVEQAPLPCIVLWNQEYYVVVHNIKTPRWRKAAHAQATFHVSDPARGRLTFSAAEFSEHWLADA